MFLCPATFCFYSNPEVLYTEQGYDKCLTTEHAI